MASLIPHLEYDIFISYRHNDNRSGWVSAFVKALKVELAATIKEPLSVYFDTNDYDGLLENHDVDKSLEGKLRSMIFIPVISQTYCDTKSFAWQHEFIAYNRLCREDNIRRDIKLNNGNVASRILPIKIHDLDAEDKATIETELGCALRAIEFIFQSPGVNRPLNVSDTREDNGNGTVYKDQMNKVANAIKEITNGIRFPDRKIVEVKEFIEVDKEVKSAIDSKSIAVLPFRNLGDPSQEYFADGITENILMDLCAIPNVRVISRTSIMRYKNSTKSAPEIASELGVKYILEGSAQSHGNKVRINVQLIDALTEDNIWSKVFVESLDDIFEIQTMVAEVVAKEFQEALSPKQNEKAKDVPTKNPEAYDLFMKGRHAFNQWGVEGYKAATEYFKQAIDLDPDFKQAYSYLASSYSARMSWNGDLGPKEAQVSIEKYLQEAWQRGPSENDYLTKAFVAFFITKDFAASERLLKQALELSANNANVMYTYSYVLYMMGRFEEALQWVGKAKTIDPLTVAYFNYQTIGLYLLGQHQEAISTLKEGLKLYPSVLRFYDYSARVYLTIEDYAEAEKSVLEGFRISGIRPPSMVASLAIVYYELGREDKSRALLDELMNRSAEEEMGVKIYVVYIFNSMGNLPEAQRWLFKARETNDVGLIWWQVDPLLKDLREYVEDLEKKEPDFVGAEKHVKALLEKEMPKLPYHNIEHINDVVQAALKIAKYEKLDEEDSKILKLAALLHDVGFIKSSKDHEAHGVTISKEILPSFGFKADQIEVIANMIMATRLPQSPITPLENVLCDADLDYLGREDFYEIGNRLFEELKNAEVVDSEREWNLVQKTFLESHKYHTAYGRENREASKQQRLQEIREKLKKR